MDNLQTQIENLRTLQQSYDQLGAAAEAYNEGKPALAQAINAKGVLASAADSLATMAEKIGLISQETIVADGGKMYEIQICGSADTPNYWNLYQVLIDLLNNTEASEFGGIVLGEFYKGYDSITMGGGSAPSAGTGGGYVFSDEYSVSVDNQGHRTVSFTIHRADGIHTWNDFADGKGNRWVAWLLAYNEQGTAGLTITDQNTCPRSIFIGRSVGAIAYAGSSNGRISEIVVPDIVDANGNRVINELLEFNSGTTYEQNFCRSVVLRNIKNQTHLAIKQQSTESVYFQGEEISGEGSIAYAYPNLKTLIIDCPKISNTNQYGLIRGTTSTSCGISTIIIKTEDMQTRLFGRYYASNGDLSNLREIVITEIESGSVRLETEHNRVNAAPNFNRVYIGYKNEVNDKTKSVSFTGHKNIFANVTLFEIKDGWCKPLSIPLFEALTKTNVQTYIFDRLGVNDISTGTVTITLASAVLALFTQEEIDAVVERTNITIVGA